MGWSGLLKDRKGVAAVEFAIVLPILVIILLGILDFALLFYNKQVLTNASREGARAAIVVDNRGTDPNTITGAELTALQDIIKDYCEDRLINLGGNNALVLDPEFEIDTTTGHITATVRYDYDHLFSNILGFLNFSSTQLTGRTVMRSE